MQTWHSMAASSTRRSTSATTCFRHSEPHRQLTPFSWKGVHAQDSIKQKHTKTIIIINHTKSDNDDKINTHTHTQTRNSSIWSIERERDHDNSTFIIWLLNPWKWSFTIISSVIYLYIYIYIYIYIMNSHHKWEFSGMIHFTSFIIPFLHSHSKKPYVAAPRPPQTGWSCWDCPAASVMICSTLQTFSNGATQVAFPTVHWRVTQRWLNGDLYPLNTTEYHLYHFKLFLTHSGIGLRWFKAVIHV